MSRSADKAYAAIHEGIVNARYAPGQHLKEEELSAEIGLSRTPIREALRRLANEGLVVFARNQGTFVTTFEDDDIDEIFQLRAMLEAHGVRRAARRITAAQLARLEAIADEMDALEAGRRGGDSVYRFNAVNGEFHKVILEASESERLRKLLSSIIDIPLILMKHYNWRTRVNLARSCLHHRELIAALRARDENWAGSMMAAHVLGARTGGTLAPGTTPAETADEG